jgi:glyoxylase-like metal-dependent hydrolase (beta-lactamase superfamily II)
MPSHLRPTRREFLVSGTAAAMAAATLPGLIDTARAAAPPAGTQAPGYYRVRVGGLEVTALLDGHLEIPPAMFSLPPAEATELLRAGFRPDGPIRTPVNAFAVNTGEKLYLIDAGTAAGFAPGLAKLSEALAAADILPEAVDAVILTHLHVDHAGGLVRDGQPVYPNAQIVLADAEAAFWLDETIAAQAPDDAKPFFAMAQASLAPYGDRVTRLGPAASEAVPGIEATPLPGHTPGHTGYVVGQNADRLWLWGDVVHAAALQFARPEATIAFDTDPAGAAASRKRAFDRAAGERLLVAGVHLPFPGLGYVDRAGDGYRFVPAPWQPL